MFFNNNDRGPSVNVNTTVDTFWSDLSSLTIGCWNDKITLRWLPALQKDERGLTHYNKDAKISTSVSHVKIAALLQRYEQRLKDMVEAGEDPGEKGKSIMIPITPKDGGTAGLFIQYKRDEKGKPALYLTYAKQLMEVGADPRNIISYKFNELSMMDDMSPEAGGGEQVEVKAEFDYFMQILRSHILMTGLNSHSTRYSNGFTKQNSAGANASDMGADAFMNSNAFPDTDGLTIFS